MSTETLEQPVVKEPAEPLLSKRRKKIMSDPLNDDNPITIQVAWNLFCTCGYRKKWEPTFVMSVAVIFVIVFSNLIISIIRNLGTNQGKDHCTIGNYRNTSDSCK